MFAFCFGQIPVSACHGRELQTPINITKQFPNMEIIRVGIKETMQTIPGFPKIAGFDIRINPF